eukprot:7194795-Heterocapsa_arctica.AAC.1
MLLDKCEGGLDPATVKSFLYQACRSGTQQSYPTTTTTTTTTTTITKCSKSGPKVIQKWYKCAPNVIQKCSK